MKMSGFCKDRKSTKKCVKIGNQLNGFCVVYCGHNWNYKALSQVDFSQNLAGTRFVQLSRSLGVSLVGKKEVSLYNVTKKGEIAIIQICRSDVCLLQVPSSN